MGSAAQKSATQAMRDNFTPNTVLLVVESQTGTSGAVKVGGWSSTYIPTMSAEAQADIFETEGSREAFLGTSIFARSQQEEKGNAGHVCHCLLNMSTRGGISGVKNILQDRNWHWFNPVRRWVLSGKGAEDQA
jgi:hypothetical protein